MKRLLEFLILDFREFLLLTFFCLVSLALVANKDTPALRGIRSAGLEAFSAIEARIVTIQKYFGLVGENNMLRERNAELAVEVSIARNAVLENEQLKRFLAYRHESRYPLKLAQIIDRTFNAERNLLMINVGSDDSITVNMPVLTDKGLVGRVILVSPNYALVQPIINRDFKVGVVTEKTRTAGVLSWKPSEHLATVEHVLLSSEIQAGERLLTAEFSSFVGANVPVGVVQHIDRKAGQLFYKIDVALAVEFDKLNYVFVQLRPPSKEKETMQKRFKEFQ